MAGPEDAYKSLQIYRPVIETPAMHRFWKNVDEIGKLIFEPKDSILVPAIGIEDEGDTTQTRTEGISRHNMYDRQRLKLTLLDKRSRVREMKPLLRAYERLIETPESVKVLARGKNRQAQQSRSQNVPDWRQQIRQAALLYDIVDPEDAKAMPELRVTFDILAVTTNPGFKDRGTEMALFPSPPDDEALLLHSEADICFDALALINPNVAYPTGKINPQVSIVRLPVDATPGQTKEFYTEVTKQLPIDLNLAPPKPDLV